MCQHVVLCDNTRRVNIHAMSTTQHPIDEAAHLLGGRAGLAKRLRVTPAALGNWKVRGVPIEHCPAIERATSGAVTRRDLRPEDWREIWPELAESEPNQPAAPANQAQAAINSEAKEAASA